MRKTKSGKRIDEDESDTDFMERDSEDDEAESGVEPDDPNVLKEIEAPQDRRSRISLSQASPTDNKGRANPLLQHEPS